MGTRNHVVPEDLAEDMPYQVGMPWMCLPEEDCHTKKDFRTRPPDEEKRNCSSGSTVAIVGESNLLSRCRSFRKAVRIMATVRLVFIKWRTYKRPREWISFFPQDTSGQQRIC